MGQINSALFLFQNKNQIWPGMGAEGAAVVSVVHIGKGTILGKEPCEYSREHPRMDMSNNTQELE